MTNTTRGHIVRIPILPHGDPGEAGVLADDSALDGIDGITMDVHGRIVAAIIGQDSIVGVCARTGRFKGAGGRRPHRRPCQPDVRRRGGQR